MDSFLGIGPLELIFILIFALIFLGPERLPKIMREISRFLRQVRSISQELTQQINEEFGDLQDLNPTSQINKMFALDDEDDAKSSGKKSGQKSTSSGQTSKRPSTGTSAGSASAKKPAAGTPSKTSSTAGAATSVAATSTANSKPADAVDSKPADSKPADSKPGEDRGSEESEENRIAPPRLAQSAPDPDTPASSPTNHDNVEERLTVEGSTEARGSRGELSTDGRNDPDMSDAVDLPSPAEGEA